MNDVTRQLKEKAVSAIMAYKNQILEDFLAHAKNFQMTIDYLLTHGKRKDGNLWLDDALKPLGKTVIFKLKDIEHVNTLLKNLNKENAVDVFNYIFQLDPYFTIFVSFINMQHLVNQFSNCVEGINAILNC